MKMQCTRTPSPPEKGDRWRGVQVEDMCCCSWHEPRNAVVELKSGILVPDRVLALIPDSKAKEHMIHSGGMCDPCARRFVSRLGPQAEKIFNESRLQEKQDGQNAAIQAPE